MNTSNIREDSETDESMYDWREEETEHSTLPDTVTRRRTRLSMLRQEILDLMSKDVRIPERDEISTAEDSAMSRLVETNRFLSIRLFQMTGKYTELIDKYNETVEGFTFELGLLRVKLDEIEKARMLTVEVPDSWISEEMLEGDLE